MDTLFGTFWPETGVPGSARAVLAALGVGRAGRRSSCRSATSGSARSWCCWRPVASSSASACNRRSPFTLACAALCVLAGGDRRSSGTPSGSWSCACWPAARSAWPGSSTAAPCRPSCSAGIAWPLAALRGLPWLGRSLRSRSPACGHSAAALRTVVLVAAGRCSSSDCCSPPPTRSSPSGSGAVVPDLQLDTFVLRAFITVAVGGVVLAATYLALNPPTSSPGPVRRGPVAHRYEWLAPVLLVDARLPGVPRRAGHRHLRRARLPRAHHRAHLRGVRPPGLRPAHRRHRAHPAGGLGGRPQGAARDGRGPGLAARVARPALRADPGRGRLRALPDARLPGGLRLHPAPPAGRRLRGLARACWCSA